MRPVTTGYLRYPSTSPSHYRVTSSFQITDVSTPEIPWRLWPEYDLKILLDLRLITKWMTVCELENTMLIFFYNTQPKYIALCKVKRIPHLFYFSNAEENSFLMKFCNYLWAIAGHQPILNNSEKKSKFVGCKIGDMRRRLRFFVSGHSGVIVNARGNIDRFWAITVYSPVPTLLETGTQ